MDEPTAGMDPEARRGIWDLLLVCDYQHFKINVVSGNFGKFQRKKLLDFTL